MHQLCFGDWQSPGSPAGLSNSITLMEGTPFSYIMPIVAEDIDGDSDGAGLNYTLTHSTTNTVCVLSDLYIALVCVCFSRFDSWVLI